MRVSKQKLIIACIVSFIALIIGGSVFIPIQKERRERQRVEEFNAAIEELRSEIYDELRKDFRRNLEQLLKCWSYSSERYRYIRKLNNILGEKYYTEDIYDYDPTLNQHSDKDPSVVKLLKKQTEKKLREKLLE